MDRIHGYLFEKECMDSLRLLQQKGYELLFWKNIDAHVYDYNLYCPFCDSRFANPFIAQKSISDLTIVTYKKVIFMECKSSKAKAFPINNIQPHQLKWSLQCDYFNVSYYFLICDRRTPKQFKCYALLGAELDNISADISPKKSISWESFENNSIELPRIKGGLWNLEPVLAKEATENGTTEVRNRETGNELQ